MEKLRSSSTMGRRKQETEEEESPSDATCFLCGRSVCAFLVRVYVPGLPGEYEYEYEEETVSDSAESDRAKKAAEGEREKRDALAAIATGLSFCRESCIKTRCGRQRRKHATEIVIETRRGMASEEVRG